MYIKKPVLIICAIVLMVTTMLVTISVVNPFGFTAWEEFFAFSSISRLVQDSYYQEVPKEEFMHTALAGIAVATGDPYTRYLWGEDAQEYMESIQGNFYGIGIYLEANLEEDTLDVVSAIVGSPAEEAGLSSGDKIMAVNGVPFTGKQLNEAVAAMRGDAETTVKITVLRKNTGNKEELELVRKEIVIPSVESKMLNQEVGYIQITQFTEGTADLFSKAIGQRIEEGMKKLVLDLRNNPGGIMSEAEQIANLFIEDGKVIVYTLDKNNHRTEYIASGDALNIPIVVLTNQGSASASEILTGALKDYQKAYHIGEKTYGKGVVQEVYSTEDAVLSVTVSRYYTPNGTCIHEEGITPEQVIVMNQKAYANLSDLTLDEDLQLHAALEYLTE